MSAQSTGRGIRSLVIVGGGTAGWMAAAALARVLAGSSCEITLVESAAVRSSGLDEGTIPTLPAFHRLLEVDEREFLRATRATFKLATQFRDWGSLGEVFLHPFGSYGLDTQHSLFQAYWLKCRQEGHPSPLEEWSVTGLAASMGRFGTRLPAESSVLRGLSYAYHLDTGLYARFLRTYALNRGVRRIDGVVVDVTVNTRGLVEALRLQDGRSIDGDFFIDCSGFAAVVVQGALRTGYVDWSHWLACDRAVAVHCESAADPAPVTQSTARECGWQWRIPLQHRVSTGYVYSSAYVSDDEARMRLCECLEGAPLCDPLLLHFKAGRRRQAWVGNCLALGLAAGCLEPLGSTHLHLVQTALGRLFALFPDRDFDAAISAEYNRLTALEYEHVRDFLILHYVASRREDAPFWQERRAMQLPETLTYKRDLFVKTGHIAMMEEETFLPASWLALYAGLHVWPERHEPIVDILACGDMAARFAAMRANIRKSVETLPAHATFLREIGGR